MTMPEDPMPGAPGAPGGAPLLLTGCTVHSTAEPYAEAMIVEDGLITWAGSEETAQRLSDDRFDIRDCEGALVAPAFVGWLQRDLLAASERVTSGGPDPSEHVREALDRAAAVGCGAVRMSCGVSREDFLELTVDLGEGESTYDRYDAPRVIERLLGEALQAAAEHPVQVWPAVRVVGLAGLDLDDPRQASFLMDLIWLARGCDETAGVPVALEMNLWDVLGVGPEQAESPAAVDRLLEIRRSAAGAGRQLILDAGHQDEQGKVMPAKGEEAGVVVRLLARTLEALREERQAPAGDLPTVLSGFDPQERQSWQALVGSNVHVVLRRPGSLGTALSVGVPLSVAPPEGENPWRLVSDHVHHGDGVSVRAAFNAQARGAHRGFPGASGLGGQLNPGAEASYALWGADSLAVQTPDARTAAWSTDVRARTPLLPYLDGETMPRLLATVVRGVEAQGGGGHGGHSGSVPGRAQGGEAE